MVTKEAPVSTVLLAPKVQLPEQVQVEVLKFKKTLMVFAYADEKPVHEITETPQFNVRAPTPAFSVPYLKLVHVILCPAELKVLVAKLDITYKLLQLMFPVWLYAVVAPFSLNTRSQFVVIAGIEIVFSVLP